MPEYRRSDYLFFTLEELGEAAQSPPASSWVVTSPLSGQHLLVSPEELERIRRVPAREWVHEDELVREGFTREALKKLCELAILLSHGESSRAFLQREEALVAAHWPPCAAVYHLLNHQHESRVSPPDRRVDISALEQESDDRALRFLGKHGLPPPTFLVHPKAREIENLPAEVYSSGLTVTLRQRRTCRQFAPNALLGMEDFSSLMRWTLGPVATRTVAGRVELLLKTSPSGGSLHPIEAFPLLFRCEGKKSGIYHYRCDQHALALLQELSEDEARELAMFLAQGQTFAGSCSALVLLVARFDRNFWKYRERENSYAVVLQDAGHLSQTFQLVATDLGLGSFYTAAINSEAIVQLLSLKYPAEAPIGILGVGIPANSPAAGIEEFTLRRQGL